MAAPPSPAPAPPPNYFTTRPTPRRPAAGVLAPSSPRTPLLGGRSISAQFGTPGSFRGASEQEEVLVYELSERCISAGWAGEARPRGAVSFTPEMGRREGDYRQYDSRYSRRETARARRKGTGE
ncbi:hypothetical protein LTR53_015926, partial [Teratosphaeriaceae sp. CCFEE 6253]